MPASPHVFRSLVVCSLVVFSAATPAVAKEPAGSLEFFENRIRPVLVQRCYECHAAGADELGGSLRLDTADAMRQGGDSGPAIIPGDAAASLLVSAIRYDSSEMPPSGKLPESTIQDFEAWIAAGATDPRDDESPVGVSQHPMDLERGRQFWAFQPLSFTPPDLQSAAAGSPIDQFLARRLAAAGIVANGSAGLHTRLRRLCFDLTGLPPAIELQQRWLDDPSESHWQRIVDELLDSIGFAEHWARHWMDVARYADSNGSDFNATFHKAWRYRNYLIESFAADRPFDEMIRQQIAGDQLPAETDTERHDNVVASTFLMLGTKMLSERDKAKLELDVVDEQIDTIGRAFLGMTLGCARCHDHKFDPVPMRDYYALAGIFKSTVTLNGESQKYVSTWNRISLPSTLAQRQLVLDYNAESESLQAEIKQAEKRLADAKAGVPEALPGIVIDDSAATKTGFWKASTYTKDFIGTSYVHDNNSKTELATIRFAAELPSDGRYEVRVAYAASTSRAAEVPVSIETAMGTQTVILDQRRTEIKPFWSTLGTFEFKASAPAVVTLSNQGTLGYVIADAVQFLAQDDLAQPRELDESSQLAARRRRIEQAEQNLSKLKTQFKTLTADPPAPLPVAMAPTDRASDEIANSHLHIRGEAGRLGDVVPRGFLQVCSSGDATIANPRGSGRLDLADWLTDPDQPLVARVFVNRVWMHLMGEGLVRTVDNFGERGERPSHPELLDFLASEFVRGGWHLKPLVRQIVTSAAYQRSSDYVAANVTLDPEDRLWWRMPRRRLPAESIRDAMLAVTGTLDRSPTSELMKSHGVLVSGNAGNSDAGKIDGNEVPRRSIYLPVVRSYISAMMTALDGADPDLLVGRRPTTNVPGQALVLINSPEINQWARTAAQRILSDADGFDAQLRLAYRLCLQREPQPRDVELATKFFANDSDSLDGWQQWVAAMFAGTEFRLLD